MTIRVVVADDHTDVLAAVAETLDSDERITVVSTVTTGHEAWRRAAEGGVDVVVVDVHMPDDGVGTARRLRELPDPPVVVALSAQSGARVIEEMVRAGSSGYVTKGHAGERLIDVVCRCAAGEVVLASPLATSALTQLLQHPHTQLREAADLSALGQSEPV